MYKIKECGYMKPCSMVDRTMDALDFQLAEIGLARDFCIKWLHI
jgi:hypothetical protein